MRDRDCAKPSWLMMVLTLPVFILSSGWGVEGGVPIVQPPTELPDPPVGFVLIPAGSFTMGSPSNERLRDGDETQHQVTISRAYWMQRSEVTQAQWQELMGTKPWHFENCGDDCPVEAVNWWEALAYCNALSGLEGFEECYQMSGCEGQPGEGMTCQGVEFRGLGCQGYRLPTEAEWEYAARAGTSTSISSGELRELGYEHDPSLARVGWYRGNAATDYQGCREINMSGDMVCMGPHPAGSREPNVWGLFDMHGNVWEWCWDSYDHYPSGAVSDPTGGVMGSNRVIRGGSWDSLAYFCRSANRLSLHPTTRFFNIGFRPVRTSSR